MPKRRIPPDKIVEPVTHDPVPRIVHGNELIAMESNPKKGKCERDSTKISIPMNKNEIWNVPKISENMNQEEATRLGEWKSLSDRKPDRKSE